MLELHKFIKQEVGIFYDGEELSKCIAESIDTTRAQFWRGTLVEFQAEGALPEFSYLSGYHVAASRDEDTRESNEAEGRLTKVNAAESR